MAKLLISKQQAREFLVRYQGLACSKAYYGEKGILDYFKRVGCIQYDPLNVVGRNADLVLQSRISGYSAAMLEKLLYEDRSLTDGWDKMMSIYRSDDWSIFRRIREEKRKEILYVLRLRNSIDAESLTKEVREAIIQRGPLLASQIKLGEAGKGKWGHRNLSGAAMDYMFNIGELGIYAKKGTQKVYDLTENLIANEILNRPDPFKTDRDFFKWYFMRRIGSIGLLWDRNGGGWLGHFLSDKELRKSILSELAEQGCLTEIRIEGIDETFYARQEDLALLDLSESSDKPVVYILAPLDNLLWDREMTEKIFNFKYSWEVYLPAEKRKYGYYVLPVLYRGQFIARFEPEVQRSSDPLRVKNWWWEEGVKVNNQMKRDIYKSLNQFAAYLGTEFKNDTLLL